MTKYEYKSCEECIYDPYTFKENYIAILRARYIVTYCSERLNPAALVILKL